MRHFNQDSLTQTIEMNVFMYMTPELSTRFIQVFGATQAALK